MNFLKSIFKPKPAKVVEVDPFGARFEVKANQTLLEAALNNGIPFPYNCTVGTCGSCKSKLKEGQVNALTDFGYTLSQQEIAAGYILACSAVPKSPLTRIVVEDLALDAPPPERYMGKVASTTALTHDILRVTLELDRPLRFAAGQYVNLKFPGLDRARNYSFADAPERDGLRTINLFVRRVPGGEFTEALFSGALASQTLDVEAPFGHFYLRPNAGPMICIAGGSGLAPLLSLLEHAQRTRVKRPCAMLFGARTQADLYALGQIQAIAAAWQENFVFIPVLSHEPVDSNWTGARGLVTEFIENALPQINWSNAQGYMCGPPGMIDAALTTMTSLGVALESIYYDKFTDAGSTPTIPK